MHNHSGVDTSSKDKLVTKKGNIAKLDIQCDHSSTGIVFSTS